MGNKCNRNKDSIVSLNPNERRRLTAFLEASGSNLQFNEGQMKKLWEDLLVPSLLSKFTNFLMKQGSSNKSHIGVDEFVLIYSLLVRGSADEKAHTIANIVGKHKNPSGHDVISLKSFVQYLSDLLESYYLGLKLHNDENYKSWTHLKSPKRQTIEEIMTGVCTDIPRKGDDLEVQDLERWLSLAGTISVLNSYVLGSLYHLEPEVKASLVPRAILPSTKTPTFLDLSQVVFINSLVPSENKKIWRFLFSTSTHGESFSKLVGCISNQGPVILLVVANDGSAFGGFISQNFNLGPKWIGNGDCFLFRLHPTVDVYHTTGYNDHYAYMNMGQSSLPNGLGMGGQFGYWGLWIDSHFGEGESSESCTTFKNYMSLSSKKKFHISHLEAWAVGESPLSAEELGERTQNSVLDKDTAASHMLEMAGKNMYSKGLREEPPDN